jgi:glycosyltransferase involved in cell wall biosynthesis
VNRVGILAISATGYGGDTYFRSILPWLDRLGGNAEYLVFAPDRRYATLPIPHGRVRLIERPRVNTSALKRLLWEQLVLPRLIRALGIDVLYTANNVGIVASPCPFVVSIRNMEPLAADLRGMPRRLQARLVTLRMLTHVSLRRAARIIAVSEYVRNHILALGISPDKVRVVYHGVDVPAAGANGGAVVDELKAGFIFSAAKFVRYANTETLIRGYHAMRAAGVTKTLLIAGGSWDPVYEAEIRGLVRALDLERSVRFLGYIAHSEVLELLRTATLFIFPSTLEACPFTLLEAMACGATILTTRMGPMPEFCRDGARYFDPFDSHLLAQEAIALLNEPDERHRLATVARSRAALYQWEDSVPALLAVLSEAAGRPKR